MGISRQEATGIPNLLVAPRTALSSNRDIYADGIGDFRGYYTDGAYVAQQDESEAPDVADPQLAYFDSILTRYEVLRVQLQDTPPRFAIERLGQDHPTRVKPLNKDLTRWWIKKMKTVDPKPAQIASFDKSSVLRLLRLLTQGTLLKRGLGVEMTISRWTWSLLARLPDRGELSSEEIGVVRELGKKAVLLAIGLREQEEWAEGIEEVEKAFDGSEDEEKEAEVMKEEVPIGEDQKDHITELLITAEVLGPTSLELNNPIALGSATDQLLARGEDEENSAHTMQEESNLTRETMENRDPLAERKAMMLAQLNQNETSLEEEAAAITDVNRPIIGPMQPQLVAHGATDAKLNTKATVDMIITVAGEVYGQRDLLDFRGQWGDVA